MDFLQCFLQVRMNIPWCSLALDNYKSQWGSTFYTDFWPLSFCSDTFCIFKEIFIPGKILYHLFLIFFIGKLFPKLWHRVCCHQQRRSYSQSYKATLWLCVVKYVLLRWYILLNYMNIDCLVNYFDSPLSCPISTQQRWLLYYRQYHAWWSMIRVAVQQHLDENTLSNLVVGQRQEFCFDSI